MPIDNPVAGNEICYTDPHTGQVICVRTHVIPEKAVLNLEGPKDVIERLQAELMAKLDKVAE